MTAANLTAEAYAQVWERKATKQHMLSSVWDMLSNRVQSSDVIPSEGQTMMPTTVVYKATGKMRKGDQRITILWTSMPRVNPIAGPNKAEGKEKRISSKSKRLNYNIQRFPMAAIDESVVGDATEYYNMVGEVADVIADLFVLTTDYDHERALCEGADQWLTDTNAWQDSEYGSVLDAPVTVTMHPNAYVTGFAGKVSWFAAYGSAANAVITRLTALAATDTFDMADLDTCYLIASRTINPVKSVNGNGKYKWVLLVSDAVWNDLTASVATGSFRDLLKYTEKGFEKMYEGNIGVYKDMLVVASQKSPIFTLNSPDAQGNVVTANTARFLYDKPSGDCRNRAVTTGAGNADGTYEITKIVGGGAIGLAEMDDIKFVSKGFDYDFSKGILGKRARGTERMDFDSDSKTATSARINESSALFYTSTSAATV